VSAARVLGSRPHLSRNHIGSRSRTAGTIRSHRPGAAGAGSTTRAGSSDGAALPGRGTAGADAGAVPGVEADDPVTDRSARPPYAPAMSASARRREAAATRAARPREGRRRPGPGPGPEPGSAPWPAPGLRRSRTSEAAARPGPLPLLARCDRGAMPHDARHMCPSPLSRPISGGQPTSCGYLAHSQE
jgi:hypothetical protein